MKKVVGILKPFKLEDAMNALSNIGIHGMTVSEVRGLGRQKGHTELYRGSEYQVDLVPKIRVEIVCDANAVEKVAATLADAARTGGIGDGKILVTPVEDVIRVRTGERGEAALS